MALDHLLENNRLWAAEIFDGSARSRTHRAPTYYWIGCCDGPFGIAPRLGLEPGELFVHRNLANIVCDADRNGLASLQYGVDVLEVRHIIVCGHTACRGVLAAADDEPLGLTDCWVSEAMNRSRVVRPLEDTALAEEDLVALCERNVRAQISRLCHLSVVRDAWRRDQSLSVHGWIHDDDTGLFKEIKQRRCIGHSAVQRGPNVTAATSFNCTDQRHLSHDDTTA